MKAPRGWRRGLLLGALGGLLSKPLTDAAGPLAPGLCFGLVFLPWTQAPWRRAAALAVSATAWWIAYQGAAHAGASLAHGAAAQLLFWARWGGLGALLLSLGLLALGFPGLRTPRAHAAAALTGAALAQAFWLFGNGDAAFWAAFVLWQGGLGALLTHLTQAPGR